MPSLLKPVEKKGVLSYEEILKNRQKLKSMKAKDNSIKPLMSKNKENSLSASKTQLANLTVNPLSLNLTAELQTTTANSTLGLLATTTDIGTTISVVTTIFTTKITTNKICKNLGIGKIEYRGFGLTHTVLMRTFFSEKSLMVKV